MPAAVDWPLTHPKRHRKTCDRCGGKEAWYEFHFNQDPDHPYTLCLNCVDIAKGWWNTVFMSPRELNREKWGGSDREAFWISRDQENMMPKQFKYNIIDRVKVSSNDSPSFSPPSPKPELRQAKPEEIIAEKQKNAHWIKKLIYKLFYTKVDVQNP